LTLVARTRSAVLTAALAIGLSSCREASKKEVVAAAHAESPTQAPEDAAAPIAATRVCPAVDAAKLAPFEVDRSLVTADVPKVRDERGSLAPFYDRVLALARGARREHVRIGVWGDSNLTSDFLTGHVRRALQARFGDGGHGYVALARPWAWYTHEDVHHHGTWDSWKQLDPTTDPVPGHRYGFANLAAESTTAGAASWVRTADSDSPIGRTASRFEVYFLRQPHGGSFDVELDGSVTRTVWTEGGDFEAGYERFEVDDAPHELRCVVKGDGVVRLYGATMERADASIIVDSLGTGAMNFQRFLLTEPVVRRAQLAHRAYDLVVVWLGTNSTWLEPNRGWIKDTIAAFRDAIPNVPVLLLPPPDSVKAGEKRSDPRIVEVSRQIRDAAAENAAAFWDLRAAQGGDASFLFFMSHRLASPDRAHLLREGSQLVGQRLLAALFDGVAARLEAAPDAGCPYSM
jgi:hypothetical protein